MFLTSLVIQDDKALMNYWIILVGISRNWYLSSSRQCTGDALSLRFNIAHYYISRGLKNFNLKHCGHGQPHTEMKILVVPQEFHVA